jgi:hypothetical protein
LEPFIFSSSIKGKEGNEMKKLLFLGLLIVFFPPMGLAQEKVDAPVWNVGNKWTFTGDGSIEVIKSDQSGDILKFSDGICFFEKQGCSVIVFEKSTRNRTNAVEGDKRKKYTMGLKKILDFPLSSGKLWTYTYSAAAISPHAKFTFYYDYSESFKVSGWEDVQVKAGKFKTLKLEYKRLASSSFPAPDTGEEVKNQYWYSPDVKYFVKCQYDKDWMKDKKENFNWELISFQLKK